MNFVIHAGVKSSFALFMSLYHDMLVLASLVLSGFFILFEPHVRSPRISYRMATLR